MNRTLIHSAVAVALLGAVSAQAQTVSLNLGVSNENLTLTSQGGGFMLIQQGNCGVSAGTTTCDLTGTFTSSVAGFTSGTYDFITSYTDSTNPIQVFESDPTGPDEFQYSSLSATTNMTIDLTTASGTTVEPLVAGGAFVTGTNFSFGYTAAEMCSGLPTAVPCSQDNVSLNAGSSLTGPVVIAVSFPAAAGPVPEPGTLPLMLAAGVLVGAYRIRRQRSA